jgi:hypothetical protein
MLYVFSTKEIKRPLTKNSSTQIIHSGLILNQIAHSLRIWELWSSEGRISLRTHTICSGSSYWCRFPSEVCQLSNKHFSMGTGCFRYILISYTLPQSTYN